MSHFGVNPWCSWSPFLLVYCRVHGWGYNLEALVKYRNSLCAVVKLFRRLQVEDVSSTGLFNSASQMDRHSTHSKFTETSAPNTITVMNNSITCKGSISEAYIGSGCFLEFHAPNLWPPQTHVGTWKHRWQLGITLRSVCLSAQIAGFLIQSAWRVQLPIPIRCSSLAVRLPGVWNDRINPVRFIHW